MLRLWFCSISTTKSDPNPGAIKGMSVFSESLSTEKWLSAPLLNQEKRIPVHLLIVLSEDLNRKAGSSYR